MKTKKAKKIAVKVRAQVLEAMMVPGYVATDLIRSYGISKSTIYKWRKQLKTLPESTGLVIDSDCATKSRFVEVSVKGPSTKACDLKKASLIFDDFSISIEGKISSSKLLAVLKVLEDSC